VFPPQKVCSFPPPFVPAVPPPVPRDFFPATFPPFFSRKHLSFALALPFCPGFRLPSRVKLGCFHCPAYLFPPLFLFPTLLLFQPWPWRGLLRFGGRRSFFFCKPSRTHFYSPPMFSPFFYCVAQSSFFSLSLAPAPYFKFRIPSFYLPCLPPPFPPN